MRGKEGNDLYFVFRLAKFVDKFGARPSGSEVLEQSIDYMIQLTKDEDIDDITTETLEVEHFFRLLSLYKKKMEFHCDLVAGPTLGER